MLHGSGFSMQPRSSVAQFTTTQALMLMACLLRGYNNVFYINEASSYQRDVGHSDRCRHAWQLLRGMRCPTQETFRSCKGCKTAGSCTSLSMAPVLECKHTLIASGSRH